MINKEITFKEWIEKGDTQELIRFRGFTSEYLSNYVLTKKDENEILEVYRYWPKREFYKLSVLVMDWLDSPEYKTKEQQDE